jgi:hypothetical protein
VTPHERSSQGVGISENTGQPVTCIICPGPCGGSARVRGRSRALVIHLQTAQAPGLPMPPTVLFQADAILKEESVGARLAVRVGERPVRKSGVFTQQNRLAVQANISGLYCTACLSL